MLKGNALIQVSICEGKHGFIYKSHSLSIKNVT